MAANQGRLFVKKTDEGGADQVYDGAAVSDFAKAAGNAKPSSNFAAHKPRFEEHITPPAEVEVQPRGIADAAHGKVSATWAAAKPRFVETQAVGGDYTPAQSDFEKAAHNTRPSPMMATPERQKERSAGWITNSDQVATPPPAELPGAFQVKNKPSPFAQAGAQRFKDQYNVASYGDPGAEPSSTTSDFAKAASNTKPSPNAMAASTRFKNDVVSYGDPGAHQSQADLERQAMESKISHQRQQAEAAADRVTAKYQ